MGFWEEREKERHGHGRGHVRDEEHAAGLGSALVGGVLLFGGNQLVLTAESLEYMESGVSPLVGRRNALLGPASARGFGIEMDARGCTATVFLPAAGAELTLSNCATTGKSR